MTKIGPQIILITGTMAAGKSSIAQSLAERLPKSLHVIIVVPCSKLIAKMAPSGVFTVQEE